MATPVSTDPVYFGFSETDESKADLDTLWGYATGTSALPDGRLGPDLKTYLTNNAVYNVRDIGGAKGNGVDADGLKIQATIAKAAQTGGRVIVPRGVYVIEVPLLVPSNVKVEGEGRSFTRFVAALPNQDVIAGGGVSNVHVAGIGISGSFGMGLAFAPCTNVTIEACEVSGGTLPNATGRSGGIYIAHSTGVRLLNNLLHDNGTGAGGSNADILVGSDGNVCTDVVITGNSCTSTRTAFGIAAFSCSYSRVFANLVDGPISTTNNNGYGIMLYADVGEITDVAVYGNVVRNCGGSGIYMRGTIARASVTGNTMYSVALTQDDGSLGASGITIADCRGIAVTGNSIDGSGKTGITALFSVAPGAAAKSITITGNTIANCLTRPGVWLRGFCDGVVVANNAFDTCFTGVSTFDGNVAQTGTIVSNNKFTNIISVAVQLFNSSDATVQGNMIRACGSYGIQFALGGTRNNVIANIVHNANASLVSAPGISIDTTETTIAFNHSYGTNEYGVEVRANATGCRVIHNNLKGCRVGPLLDAALDTVVEDNAGYNPVGMVAVSVPASSPMTVTAGSSPETVYFVGGTLTGVLKQKNDGSDASMPTSGGFVSIHLNPHQWVGITFSVAPTSVWRDIH